MNYELWKTNPCITPSKLEYVPLSALLTDEQCDNFYNIVFQYLPSHLTNAAKMDFDSYAKIFLMKIDNLIEFLNANEFHDTVLERLADIQEKNPDLYVDLTEK